jgi:Secretion system C-terminal sorting domain
MFKIPNFGKNQYMRINNKKYRCLFTLIVITTLSFQGFSQRLENGDFEDLTDTFPEFWSNELNPSGLTLDSGKAYSGTYCMKITDTWTSTGGGVDLTSNKIKGIEDTIYHASGMFNISSGAAELYINFFDEDSVRIDFVRKTEMKIGAWTLVSVSGKAPPGTKFITIVVYSTSANTGSFLVDSLSFGPKGVLSVSPSKKLQLVSVYPNPTEGLIYVNGLNAKADIRVIDNVGTAILKVEKFSQDYIDLSHLNNGVYFIQLEQEESVRTFKVMLTN